MLFTIEKQLGLYRQRIEELFARHPDHDLFGSLPGAGPKIRQKNRSHPNALRRLGHRWLKIIHKMWLDRTPYNAEFHHRNQLKHGSWIFQLEPNQ
jgi:hypothetical protein